MTMISTDVSRDMIAMFAQCTECDYEQKVAVKIGGFSEALQEQIHHKCVFKVPRQLELDFNGE